MTKITCPLIKEEIDAQKTDNHYSYSIKVGEAEVDVFLCINCKDKLHGYTQPHIIKGLIANNKIADRIELVSTECTIKGKISNCETIVIPDYFESADYPKSSKEKLNHLFLNLYNIQSYDGEQVQLNISEQNFIETNYFQNFKEAQFYLEGLRENGWIHIGYPSIDRSIASVSVTHLGLINAIELKEDGSKSRLCFIAMSFDPSTQDIRDAIKRALSITGYKAVIIDEQLIDSERTINDEIIASLKKVKFCIADFSLHSKGVYFESGFALGLGKKVI